MAEQEAVIEQEESTEQTAEQAEEQQQEQEQQPEAEEQQQEEVDPDDPGSIHDDPLLSSLYEDLGLISKPKVEEEVEIEQVEEPAEEAAEESEPEPEPEPEKPPKTPKSFEVKTPSATPMDVRDAVREEFEKYKLPEPKKEEVAAEPRDAYEDSLLDEQKDELSLAKYAEKKMPDKYKGMASKLVEFYKKVDDYAAKAQEDPDRSLDGDDEQLVDFISKNKPKFGKSDSKKLERMMWTEEAVAQADRRAEEKNKQFEEKLHHMQTLPRIDREIEAFEKTVPGLIPDELGEAIKEKGLDKAAEDNPYEVSIVKDKLGTASDLAREYLNISNGITPFNSSDNGHAWLLGFVNNQADYFSKNGGNGLVRQDQYGNSASFVTPAEFARLTNEGKATGKWTFTPDDVLKMIGANAVKEAQDTIKSEEERLTKMGFVRQKKDPAAEPKKKKQAKQEDKPITPPKSKSSAGPGVADTSAIEEPTPVGNDIISILNMKE